MPVSVLLSLLGSLSPSSQSVYVTVKRSSSAASIVPSSGTETPSNVAVTKGSELFMNTPEPGAVSVTVTVSESPLVLVTVTVNVSGSPLPQFVSSTTFIYTFCPGP